MSHHDDDHPLLVTVQDIRAARYCLAGVRPWFRRHGLDWPGFLDAGIAAARLRATGDALIEPVIAAANARVAEARVNEARVAGAHTPANPEARDGRA